jgi:hypothetical protein
MERKQKLPPKAGPPRTEKLNQKLIQKLFTPKSGFKTSPKVLSKSDFDKIHFKKIQPGHHNTENRSLWKRLLKLPKLRLGGRSLSPGRKPPMTFKSKILNTKSVKDYDTTNNWNVWSWIKRSSAFVKGLKGMNGKIIFKKALALATIFAVMVMAYFQDARNVQAATFTLYQTEWTSVQASETHNPVGGQTTIATYSAKDTYLDIVNGGADLQLGVPPDGSVTQTNDGETNTGFNLTGKTFSQTEVTGTGDGGKRGVRRANRARIFGHRF